MPGQMPLFIRYAAKCQKTGSWSRWVRTYIQQLISAYIIFSFFRSIARALAKFKSLDITNGKFLDYKGNMSEFPTHFAFFDILRQGIGRVPESLADPELNAR